MNHHEQRTKRLELAREDLVNALATLQRRVDKLQEQASRGQQPPQGDVSGYVSLGITTSAFAARNGNVFPGGTAKLTYPVPSSDNSTCTNTDQQRTVTAYNWTGNTVASGALVLVQRVYGVWLLVSQDCSSVAVPAPASGSVAVTTQSGTPTSTQSNQQVSTQ